MNFLQRIRICSRKSTSTQKYLRTFSSESDQQNSVTGEKMGGYAKAFDKFENFKTEEPQKLQTFPSLLRNSKFVDVSR